jgi:hypothetical protein
MEARTLQRQKPYHEVHKFYEIDHWARASSLHNFQLPVPGGYRDQIRTSVDGCLERRMEFYNLFYFHECLTIHSLD